MPEKGGHAARGGQLGLQVGRREVEGVEILDIQGRATIGVGNDTLHAELRKTFESGARKVLLNLASLSQMDSSGISTVVRGFVTMQRAGGSLKLLKPSGHVRDVLELTRLLNAIPSFDDEAKAVASFK